MGPLEGRVTWDHWKVGSHGPLEGRVTWDHWMVGSNGAIGR